MQLLIFKLIHLDMKNVGCHACHCKRKMLYLMDICHPTYIKPRLGKIGVKICVRTFGMVNQECGTSSPDHSTS